MRFLRLGVMLALIIGLFVAALPSMAAQGATIDSLVVNTADCTLTVTFTVQDAGDYYVQIWDDGVLEYAVGGATAAGATVAYTMAIGPVAQDSAGIGVYIYSAASGGTYYDDEDPYNPDFGDCNGSEWTDPVAASADCPNPTPSGFVVRSIPAGALTFFKASLDAYTGFNLPAGETWYTGTAEDGFVEVWIACQATNIFVPAENVVN
ncbi:MAG: hypothetical protein L6Q98_01030 [Anaerolineae bacterium]|nr:hypothetical protein [Anaerolineae bacterium]NUQ03937.1 hypothetical protein [Anaerolineae bacterium]